MLLHQIGGDLVFSDGAGYAGGRVEFFAGLRVVPGKLENQTLQIEEHGQRYYVAVVLLLSQAHELLFVQIVGEREALILRPCLG